MGKWEKVRLGDVGSYVNGFAFKPEDWSIQGLPIIRIQNLTESRNEVNYYAKSDKNKYEINDGDVLISWSASLGVYQWSKGRALLNQHIFKVIFDKLEINKKYFIHVITHLLKDMSKETHGSTMKHITKSRFDNMKIPFPPLEIQQKIAATLDTAAALLKLRQQQLAELEALIQSVFYQMFGDPVRNEKGWDYVKLSNLGTLNRGMSKHRPRNDPKLLNGEYPLIQTGDVANADFEIKEYSQSYSELGLKQSKMWSKGTLCITIAANIAKTAIMGFDACFPDSVVGFNANEKTNNIFIYCWFGFFQKILEEQAPESAQKNINLRILNDLDVILPPKELQTQFAAIVQKIEQQKALVQQSIDETQTLFDSLMSQYFD
ncbi:restriction endonuclease subunit S [Acetobacterium malicum]|uniref:Restriction endonuclease subunit S n=1 Tax=Acetobacterium malicum TaxID=52692 RepID=A0ABR6Z156_9FIRM|nr:restriction endonuclease subunit S [Acetobacterium malicum]MBC3901248.1 restriction endonuclease subunit S [Acetobacterium malicum]